MARVGPQRYRKKKSLYSPCVFLKVIIFAQGQFNFRFRFRVVNFKLRAPVTELRTYLTMRNRAISEEINRLLLAQLTEKFLVFDAIRRFVTTFKRAHSLLKFK